jgi:hypothetical protein
MLGFSTTSLERQLCRRRWQKRYPPQARYLKSYKASIKNLPFTCHFYID